MLKLASAMLKKPELFKRASQMAATAPGMFKNPGVVKSTTEALAENPGLVQGVARAMGSGGKELLTGSIPGALATAGFTTMTTGNPIAGLVVGTADLGASFGLSRALAGKKGNVLGMPISGKYSYRVHDDLKTGKGKPRTLVDITDPSQVSRVYEQSMPQTLAQLAGSVGAVVALEPQFMPQAYNESQAVTQQQQLAQMKYLNNMNMPDTAAGTLYQTQGIPDREEQNKKRNQEMMMLAMMTPGMGFVR